MSIPAATAILDRFLHHAEVIEITGRSYRLQHQPARPDTDSPQLSTSKSAKAPAGAKLTKHKAGTVEPPAETAATNS